MDALWNVREKWWKKHQASLSKPQFSFLSGKYSLLWLSSLLSFGVWETIMMTKFRGRDSWACFIKRWVLREFWDSFLFVLAWTKRRTLSLQLHLRTQRGLDIPHVPANASNERTPAPPLIPSVIFESGEATFSLLFSSPSSVLSFPFLFFRRHLEKNTVPPIPSPVCSPPPSVDRFWNGRAIWGGTSTGK